MAFAKGQCINWSEMHLVDSAEFWEGGNVIVKHMTNKLQSNQRFGDDIYFYYYKDSTLKRIEYIQSQSEGNFCYTIFDENLNKVLDYKRNATDSSEKARYYKFNKLIKEYNFSIKQFPKVHYYMTEPYSKGYNSFFTLAHVKEGNLVSSMVYDHSIMEYDSLGNIISKKVQNENYYEYIGDSILHYFEKGPMHYVKYIYYTYLFLTDVGGIGTVYNLAMRAYKANGIEMKYYTNNGLLERHILQDTIVSFKDIYGKKKYNVIYLKEINYNTQGDIILTLRYPLRLCIDIIINNDFNNVIEGHYKEHIEKLQNELSPSFLFYSTSNSDYKKKTKIFEEIMKYSYSKLPSK